MFVKKLTKVFSESKSQFRPLSATVLIKKLILKKQINLGNTIQKKNKIRKWTWWLFVIQFQWEIQTSNDFASINYVICGKITDVTLQFFKRKASKVINGNTQLSPWTKMRRWINQKNLSQSPETLQCDVCLLSVSRQAFILLAK